MAPIKYEPLAKGKLLKEVYKTYEGACRRVAFENGLAKGEFERGNKARHYRYSIVEQYGAYRVQRLTRED